MVIGKLFLCSRGSWNLCSSFEGAQIYFFLNVKVTVFLAVSLEKLNIKFVPAEARAGLLTAEEKNRLKKLHEDNKHFLRIPRR